MNFIQPAPRREPSPDHMILGLIRTFPCLVRKVTHWLDRVKKFDPDEFHALFERASSGEIHAALFVLNVWSSGYADMKGWRFDLMAFMSCADSENRKALLDWMARPYWP